MGVNKVTKIILAWELFANGVPKSHIAERLCVNRETVHIWVKGIENLGLTGFVDSYLNSKKGERAKRKIDVGIENLIWDLRENERECCGQKIEKFLIDRHGISLSPTTIYKDLSEKCKLRSKWKKNQARGPVPKASKPREMIQMDSIDFGEVFAFTGVDIFTKEVDVVMRLSLTAREGLIFLETCMIRRFNNHSDLIQTDGGPEFKDEFKNNIYKFKDRYRIAKPCRKNEQSYIE